MLPDSHSLLDQVVQVLGQVWGQTFGLQDPQDLVAGDEAYLGHTVRVSENHTCQEKQIHILHFKIQDLKLLNICSIKNQKCSALIRFIRSTGPSSAY